MTLIDYPEVDTVAVVKHNGEIHFKGRQLCVCSALLGLPIAFGVRPRQNDYYDVYFCRHHFMQIDLNTLKAAHWPLKASHYTQVRNIGSSMTKGADGWAGRNRNSRRLIWVTRV